jgi:hypothetical protein
MKFVVARNEKEGENGGEGSVTFDHIETNSDCPRTNKRKLKEYLSAMGVEEKQHKRVLKELGFWGVRLGRTADEQCTDTLKSA